MVMETKLKGPLGEFIFQKFCIDHQIDEDLEQELSMLDQKMINNSPSSNSE